MRGDFTLVNLISEVAVVKGYLVPAVGSVRRVDEQGEDFGFGQQGGGSFGRLLRREVTSAFLK